MIGDFDVGFQACLSGARIVENPHRCETTLEGYARFVAWRKGWLACGE